MELIDKIFSWFANVLTGEKAALREQLALANAKLSDSASLVGALYAQNEAKDKKIAELDAHNIEQANEIETLKKRLHSFTSNMPQSFEPKW